MPSLGSSAYDASGSGSPTSRRPIRSESGDTVYVVRWRRSSTSPATRSARGPAVTRSGPGTRWPRGVERCRRRPGLPHRQHVAGRHRRRSDPAERVGGPRAQDRRDADPAADGEVGPQPGAGPAEREPPARRQPDRTAERLGPPVDLDRARGAGHRDPHPCVGGHDQPAEQHLETGAPRGRCPPAGSPAQPRAGRAPRSAGRRGGPTPAGRGPGPGPTPRRACTSRLMELMAQPPGRRPGCRAPAAPARGGRGPRARRRCCR